MRQDYDDGKYTVIFDEKTGKMEALRHGEPWQDLCGNNLMYFMLTEHKSALDRIAELEKDAARYRWLRNETSVIAARIGGVGMAQYKKDEIDCRELDAAIDTAMQKD